MDVVLMDLQRPEGQISKAVKKQLLVKIRYGDVVLILFILPMGQIKKAAAYLRPLVVVMIILRLLKVLISKAVHVKILNLDAVQMIKQRPEALTLKVNTYVKLHRPDKIDI